MNGNMKAEPRNRLTGLMRSSKAGSARLMPPKSQTPAAAGADGLSHDLRQWAHTPARIPWREGADYQYRLGSHRLVLASCDGASCCEAAVGRAEAEFALVVEGPLFVFGSRFGAAGPWSWAAPYNWHFAPPAERVVPAAVPLTPETYARLWATLWITLVDTDTGRDRIGRSVTLRPEFTRALHGALREQAVRPFHLAAADRALDVLRCATDPLELRVRARTRCAAVSGHGGRWASTRTARDDAGQENSMSNPMIHDPGASIVITDGHWMHVRHTRIYHRRYPELRGEGRTLADAASHLVNQLNRCLDFVHGSEREAVERAVAEVRAYRTSRPRHRPGALAAVP